MKFDTLLETLLEADVTAQQFTDALGDDEDRQRVNADLKKKAFIEKWQEYVDEAEHQDGAGYWDNFNSVQEIAEDFALYTEHDETN